MRLIQSGPRDADLIVVGEAPGKTEDQTGKPFCGASGELLTSFLGKVGIDRQDVFITNVCHTRPPGNDFGWFLRKANQGHYLFGAMQLKKDIDEIKPNLVVAFGAQPLRALTSRSGIEKWRGSILESKLCKGQKVVGTYHPAATFHTYGYRAVIDFDMLRVAREMQFPEIRRPKRDYYLDPAPDILHEIAGEMCKASFLACDIECWQREDGSWTLACVGFSDNAGRALVIPANTPDKKETIIQLLHCGAGFIFQNGMFDTQVLIDEGYWTFKYAMSHFEFCTMLAQHALYPECASSGDEISALQGKKRKQSAIGKGLGFLCAQYTDDPFYKDDGKLWKKDGDLEMFWRYNATDTVVLNTIRPQQIQDMSDLGVTQVFKRRMSMNAPLLAMMQRGIPVDMKVRQAFKKDLELQISRLQKLLDFGAGQTINVKSRKDMMWLLYDKLALPEQKQKRKNGISTVTANKTALNTLAQKFKNPLLLSILEIRERRDVIERYLNVKIGSDNFMRFSFNIAGTRSARLSSSANIKGEGTNVQNQPPKLRRIFIPHRKDWVVWSMDYSQAEARDVAWRARCEPLIELFLDPTRDVHVENARRIYNKEDISYEERYLAKRVIHASNYGMGPDLLIIVINNDARETGITIDLATGKMAQDAYFFMYPEIREVYWESVKIAIRHSRTLVNAHGMRRQFYERYDHKLILDAISWQPQSDIGELTNIAISRCWDYEEQTWKIPDCHLWLNGHDSIVGECPASDVERVTTAVEAAMRIPMEIEGRELIIPTDIEVGRNWGKYDADANPEGLKKWTA